MDRPPSYREAMKMPPAQNMPNPTAPPTTEFYAADLALNNERFKNWDKKATNILIAKRLRKNNKFINTTSTLETDKLWHLILLELIKEQYNDFSILDLKQYWDYLYKIYKSILNNSSTDYNENWIYFKPMHEVLSKQYISSNNTSGASNASINGVPIHKPNSQSLKRKWDEKAKEILVMRRLTMNDQFKEATTSLDIDMLWKTIILELIAEGYDDFNILDLKQFWEYQFEVYKRIIDGTTNLYDRTWKYFDPMHAVFKMQKKPNATSRVITTQPTRASMALEDRIVNRREEERSGSCWWCCRGCCDGDPLTPIENESEAQRGARNRHAYHRGFSDDKAGFEIACQYYDESEDPSYRPKGYKDIVSKHRPNNYNNTNTSRRRNNYDNDTSYHHNNFNDIDTSWRQNIHYNDIETSPQNNHYSDVEIIHRPHGGSQHHDYNNGGSDRGHSTFGHEISAKGCDNSGGNSGLHSNHHSHHSSSGGGYDSAARECDNSGGNSGHHSNHHSSHHSSSGGGYDSGARECDNSAGSSSHHSNHHSSHHSSSGGGHDSGGGGHDYSSSGGHDSGGGGGYDDGGGGGCDSGGGGGGDD